MCWQFTSKYAYICEQYTSFSMKLMVLLGTGTDNSRTKTKNNILDEQQFLIL